MHELYNVINSSNEGSTGLARIYTIGQLKDFHLELVRLDEKNNNAFNSIKGNTGTVLFELTNICKAKAKISSLRKIVEEAITIKTRSQEGSLMVISHDKVNIAVAEHIVVHKQELKSVEKEVNLGTSIETNKQFFYNCRQDNMEVTNELSFEMDMMFEPLAPIPLRLQYKNHPLNKEISFEVSFF
jgi:hypothetical protein